MKRISSEQVTRFILFASPSYWTLALLFIVLAVWKTPINDPDVISVILLSAAIIIAAVFLTRSHYWISFLMTAFGILIMLQNDQHIGEVFTFYGLYLIVHYAMCGIYVYKSRKKE